MNQPAFSAPRQTQGFTLIELLIAMGLFGLALLLASNVFSSANSLTTLTVTSAQVDEDVRLALLRMTEVTSQASYIYPANQTLTLTLAGVTTTVTTGKSALALLAPVGTPYCPLNPADPAVTRAQYCVFIYRVGPRAPFTALLPRVKNPTASVLVEGRGRWVNWPVNTRPITNLSAVSMTEGVVADSIDPAASDLGQLVRGQNTLIDTLLNKDAPITDPLALIQMAQPLVSLQVDTFKSGRSAAIFVRSIPRAVRPGTGVCPPPPGMEGYSSCP